MNIALQILIVVALIGVIAGLIFNRYGRTWFGRARAGDITTALIGIAGAFLGFHLGLALGLVPMPGADYLIAIIGAFLALWAWRDR